jgi:hypothetical protein
MGFWGLIRMHHGMVHGIDDRKSALSQCVISKTHKLLCFFRIVANSLIPAMALRK